MIDKLIKQIRPGVGVRIENEYYIVSIGTAIGDFKAQILKQDESIYVWDFPKRESEKCWILVSDRLYSSFKPYLNMLFKII
jgi:hypothetical protein